MADQQPEKLTMALLYSMFQGQQKEIERLNKIVGSANRTSISDNKKAELPKIPKDLVTVGEGDEAKKYKWKVAVFHLPGSITKITAEEAATDPETIAKILAIKGQNILEEQV